ncbi:COX15/CtaA family protein [Salarchaeum sp. III]|uniref:COX15/CtaA family protein n=1 Tax=Salarchaeum sp. III TaxID=3107927 RepID=UPI002EDABE11
MRRPPFDPPRALRWLVTLSLLGTVVLTAAAIQSVALRGWMSCGGDFPKCAGQWVPLADAAASSQYTAAQIAAEWLHRAIAFLTGLLMLAATALAWWRVRDFFLTRWSLTLATALLPFEAWLGVVTGVPDPDPLYAGLHTVISLAVFALLCLAALVLWTHRQRRRNGTAAEQSA